MIISLLIRLFEIIIGFAGGLAVGAGFVAFITLLGIIPRLIQLSKTDRLIHVYGACVISGAVFGTYLSFTNLSWNHPFIFLALWGMFHGIFNGMLAAAVTEVLNVFPILAKRVRVDGYLLWLLMAFVFGKITGSLFQWFVLMK